MYDFIAALCFLGAMYLLGYHRGTGRDHRRKMREQPYSWSCETCLENGFNRFELMSNDMQTLDELILKHKERAHEGG